jgi:predicted GTPase
LKANRKQVELAMMKLMLSYLWLTLKKESRQWMMLSQGYRKVTKPVLLAVNKVDNAMREKDAIEFYNLGLENITPCKYFRKWN